MVVVWYHVFSVAPVVLLTISIVFNFQIVGLGPGNGICSHIAPTVVDSDCVVRTRHFDFLVEGNERLKPSRHQN